MNQREELIEAIANLEKTKDFVTRMKRSANRNKREWMAQVVNDLTCAIRNLKTELQEQEKQLSQEWNRRTND